MVPCGSPKMKVVFRKRDDSLTSFLSLEDSKPIVGYRRLAVKGGSHQDYTFVKPEKEVLCTVPRES